MTVELASNIKNTTMWDMDNRMHYNGMVIDHRMHGNGMVMDHRMHGNDTCIVEMIKPNLFIY